MAATARARAAHREPHRHANPSDALVDSALACVGAGNACKDHCLEEFKAGRTALAGCAERVEEMVVSCDALASLAAQGSDQVPGLAAIVATICERCERECRKHAEMHEMCLRCAEACRECRGACERAAMG